MAVELFIQHNSTIQFPVVEEGARLTLERKGTPGKLEFTVVKGPGLNFAEGDPVKLTVNGTAMFYGFVFKKKRDKGGTIDVVAYLSQFTENGFVEECQESFLARWGEAFQAEIDDFVDCVRTGRKPETTAHDGTMSLKFCLQLHQAYLDGKKK